MSKWPLIKLGKILTESKIEATNSDANNRIRVLLNANGVIKRPITKETEGATKYFERKAGQFIYGKQNLHKGAFGIIPKDLDGFSSSSDLPAFDVSDKCEPQWINYFLRQGDFYLSLVDIAKGAATKRIQPKALFEVKMPLPEIAFQKQIIKKFIAQEERTKIIDSEIQTQKLLLTQLKQSILQEAIQGKLTVDWREQNPDTETASELLKRIKSEKAQLIKDKKIKKEKALAPITTEEIPFVLPEGWVWCRLGDVSHLITKGSSPKWQGIKYVEEGLLFITSENVGTNEILLKKKKFVEQKFNELEPRSILEKGDVLTNIVGASIGRTAIWNEDISANINQAVCLVRFPDSSLNKQYLVNILNSDFGIRLMMDNQFDTGRGNLSLGAISKFKIPFPPFEEQKAIVEKVESLMQKCQALEQEIKTSEANAQMLMQAVLKEAFEGKKEEYAE